MELCIGTVQFGMDYGINGKKRTPVSECIACFDYAIQNGIKAIDTAEAYGDAEEILARFDASDYIGIVPHAVTPKYCESMFPTQYGKVIDFMHVYKEDLEKYKNDITWLPEDPAELKGNLLKGSK